LPPKKNWKLLKIAAKPPRGLIFPRAAARGGAKTEIRSSYIQNTPPRYRT
jgi:hypothetical protein